MTDTLIAAVLVMWLLGLPVALAAVIETKAAQNATFKTSIIAAVLCWPLIGLAALVWSALDDVVGAVKWVAGRRGR
jgi:energy-converting hydrogenase Eha subunit H